MKTIYILILILITINIYSSDFEKTIIRGEAAILNNDKLAAKDKALDDAKRKAVEQISGVIVSSESLTKNFELLSDNIYTNSKGYIKSYKILEEGVDKQDKGIYFVKIEANVSKGKLQNDINALNILYKSIGSPKFLLMISEKNLGEKTSSGWWNSIKGNSGSVETAISNEFIKKGIKLVNKDVLKRNLKKYSQFKNIDNITAKDVIAINNLHDGDYIIIGNVTVSVKKALGRYRGFTNGNLSLIYSKTGRIIATVLSEDLKVNTKIPLKLTEIDAAYSALEDFGKRGGKILLKKAISHWLKNNSQKEINLVVKGLNYSNYKKLKSHLTDLRGVKSINNFKMENKIASMTVIYQGTSNQLLDLIMNKPIKNLKLELETARDNELIFSVEK